MEETIVKLDVPLGEESIRLSTLDQQAQRNYANFLLAFKFDQKANVNDILHHLKQGLGVALTQVPDFASTVAPLRGSQRKELELCLGPYSGVPLRVVDHASCIEAFHGQKSPLANRNYASLAKDNFPLAAIPNEFLFAPHPSCEDPCLRGLPALLVQINVIEGGFITAISWHHTVADARGMDTFLGYWASHTKTSMLQGTAGTPKAPAEETRDRWRLAHGTQGVTITQFPEYVVNQATRSPKSTAAPHLLDRPDPVAATATLSTWYFSKEALQSLRSVFRVADTNNIAQFTNSEAVSALIWKHMSVARLLHEFFHGGTSLFATRIDFRARSRPTFHSEYIGNINEPNACARIRISEVCSPSTPQSLAELAKGIRDAVGSLNEQKLREFVGLVETLTAVTDLTSNFNTFPGPDLVVTDMSGLDMLRHEWGAALGQATCIRSGSREKGVAYFLPLDLNEGFEVQLQCEGEAVERLKHDDVFTQYAQFKC